MKIVMNALAYKPNSSGIGVMIRDLFGTYSRTTHKSCLVLLSQDSPKFITGKNTEIIRIPWKHEQGIRRILFQTFRLGRKYCRDAVFLTTDSKTPFFLPKSCKLIPIVTDLAVYRVPTVYQNSRVMLWKIQYRYVKRRANFFLAVSEFTKREMVEILKISPAKIFVLPCGCSLEMRHVENEEQLTSLRKKYNLPKEFILFVGNSNPRKNLQRMLQAFDAMKKKTYLPHQFVIAGEKGWKFEKEKNLENIFHRHDVSFLGFVPDEDMPALYSAASLFVFPTLYEGFGIPVIEAQSCGTPVITSNCSSLPEVAGDGALLVDPLNVEDICEGMIAVLQNPMLANTLIKNGYQNAKRFSWKKSVDELDKIIEKEIAVTTNALLS